MRGARAAAALAAAATLAPAPASAHLVGVEFGDFYAGALHVATAPEHAAALAATALLAALHGRHVGRWALVALPPAMALGALWAAWSPMVAFGEFSSSVAVLGSLSLLGALAALGARIGAALFAALSGLAGLAHGYANGLAAAGGGVDPLLYALGVGAAGFVAITLAAAAATIAIGRAPLLGIAYRVAGSWIAAVGVAMLGLAFAQQSL